MFYSITKSFFSLFTKSIIRCISFSLIVCFFLNTSSVYAIEVNTAINQNNSQETELLISQCENLKKEDIYPQLKSIVSSSIQEGKELEVDKLVEKQWDNLKIDGEYRSSH